MLLKQSLCAALILGGLSVGGGVRLQAEVRPTERVVHLLPIGDSITQGGKRDRAEYTYRLALQRLLRQAGVAFDFIGSRQAGLQPEAVWPEVEPGIPFDPDHEGYYGAKTAVVCARVMKVLPEYDVAPDVVLIHLGTNDQKSTDPVGDVIDPLRALVGALRASNAAVTIFLGHLNFNDSEGALRLRPLIEGLATELSTPESAVVTVHHYRGWQERPREPDSDTFDWAHPNERGQAKMALAWWEAMQRWLPR